MRLCVRSSLTGFLLLSLVGAISSQSGVALATAAPNRSLSYALVGGWNACGGSLLPGKEGCSGQNGGVFECSDGTKVYLVKDSCSSPVAASLQRQALLDRADSKLHGLPASSMTWFDERLMLELSEPIEVGLETGATNRCVLLWVAGHEMVGIYAVDRAHVLDFYTWHLLNPALSAGGRSGAELAHAAERAQRDRSVALDAVARAR